VTQLPTPFPLNKKVKQNDAQDVPTARRIGDALKWPTKIKDNGKIAMADRLGRRHLMLFLRDVNRR
jgi:hypothetical protein